MDNRPSEVFLELWRFGCGDMDDASFIQAAEAWAEIRRMEDAESGPSRAPAPTCLTEGAESTPPEAEKVHPAAAKIDADAEKKNPSPDGGPVRDDRPLEGFEVVQNGPAERDNSAIGKKAYAARLENLRQGVKDVRARGVSMQSIADAAKGLTLNDVLDFLEGKPVPLPKIVLLEKAVARWRPKDE